MGMIEVGGVALHYERRGQGPPLLCVSGAGGDAGVWTRTAEALADEFTVVSYDRRGNARSPRPPRWTSTSIDEQADDAAGLLRGLGFGPAAVLGSGSGAVILLNLALRHPETVRAAIVHEPPLLSVSADPGAVRARFDRAFERGMAADGPRGAPEELVRWPSGWREGWEPSWSASPARTPPTSHTRSNSRTSCGRCCTTWPGEHAYAVGCASQRGGGRGRMGRDSTTDTEEEPVPLEGEYEPSPQTWAREQVERYESSGGTEGTTMRDLPVVILTTRGAKSGKIRKTPLMRVEHGGQYAVVASLGGAPKNPVWYHNVVADPRVELQDGPRRQDMTAREVSGEEKALWWDRAVEAFPDYADYQKKTDREIPVFVLEPAARPL